MTEAEFSGALLDPDQPVPACLTRPDGQPAPRRFAIYRNNLTVGLTEALEASFPAVRKLVGARFFAAMAGEFLRQHPPRGRIMMLYGDEFASFLASFTPVAQLGYLPDVARLEQALRESYHAADAAPIASQALATLPEASLLAARLTLAPALRLIQSAWPIHTIWRANMEDGPPPEPGAQGVVILRPEFDPRPHLLPLGGAAFLHSLVAGHPVIEALSAAGPNLDLPAVLTLLLDGRAIVGVSS